MRGERLCHKMTGVGDALTFNNIPCITADEYCFYVRACPADYVIYIHAVHFRHNYVKQQQVNISFMSNELFQGPVSVSCGYHPVAASFKERTHDFTKLRFILGEENCFLAPRRVSFVG